MTASLVDKKSTISCDQGFAELQQNLNCMIMTANVGKHASKAVQRGLVFEKSMVTSKLKDTDRWVVLQCGAKVASTFVILDFSGNCTSGC